MSDFQERVDSTGITQQQISGRIAMNAHRRLALTMLIGAMLAGVAGTALAQQKGKTLKKQIVGTWTFVSALDVKADGTKSDRWGSNPKGIFMFDANGNFAQFITRSDLPKFGAKRIDQGTAEEFKAVMTGLVASFGTYTVNEAEKTVITHVEGSVLPDLVGVDQKRKIISLTASELKYTNPTTVTGLAAETIWKRAVSRR
jgi:hypothetical protein